MEKKRLYNGLLLVLLVTGFYITKPLRQQLFGYPGVRGSLALEAEYLLSNPETPPDLLGEPQPSPGNLPGSPGEICVPMYDGALSPPGVYPRQEGYVDSYDELSAARTFVDGHLYLTSYGPEFYAILINHKGTWTGVGYRCISPVLGDGLHVIEVRFEVASEKYTYSWAYDIER